MNDEKYAGPVEMVPCIVARRERIATAAMQGLLTDRHYEHNAACIAQVASVAVLYADRLIAEIAKPQPEKPA